MPELPDVTVYVECLAARFAGQTLEGVRLRSPFLLRTVEPPPEAAAGRVLTGVRRSGKRIVLAFENGIFFVLHLMIAGRLHLRPTGAALRARLDLAAFDFAGEAVVLTEAGPRKRAALHVVAGEDALRAFDRGGLEVLDAGPAEFAATLARENRTLKRALTDPRLFSGIGNAYSDEILHRARLSPFKLTSALDDGERARLHAACRAVLTEWTLRLRAELRGGFPDKVTAFRPEMAVHGRHRKPCPVCDAPVQRIRYADNEANYCARCQTGGRLLADRALSQLLRKDWPKTLEELEDLYRK
jgi:formamidopyrimidine-DNA glycosylase